MVALRVPLAERFHKKVNRRGPDECWPWTRYCNADGYGKIAEGAPSRKVLNAHCVSYEIHNNPIPAGLVIRHTCDNPPCCNPAHLVLDTQQGNMEDRGKKERQARGEKQGLAKLTGKKVVAIRRDYVKGSRTHGQRALARKYGVGQTVVGRIVNGKAWNCV